MKKIYDINKYHKGYINYFTKKRKEIIKDNKIYLCKKNILTNNIHDINTKLRLSTNINEIQQLKLKRQYILSELNDINSLLNFNDEKKYYDNTISILARYNSYSNLSKIKLLLSIEYIMKTKPSIYLSTIKNTFKCIKCKKCKNKKDIHLINLGTYLCKKCMSIINVITENSMISEINPNSTLKNNNYQKINYFESYLNILRGIKMPKKGKEILNLIKVYSKKYNIRNFDGTNLRSILRNINKKSYYQYIPYFLCNLDDKKYKFLKLNYKEVNLFKKKFRNILKVWNTYNHGKNKKSFFGYIYLFNKLLEFKKRYIKCKNLIPLNNSNKNIDKNDKIWHEICKKLNYKYIPTY